MIISSKLLIHTLKNLHIHGQKLNTLFIKNVESAHLLRSCTSVLVPLWERWGCVSMHWRTLLKMSRPWGISNLTQWWWRFYSFLHTIIINGYSGATNYKNRPGMVWEVQFRTITSLILNDNQPTNVKSDITIALTIMVTIFWYVIYQITCCVTSQMIAAIICVQSWHCFLSNLQL